MGAQSHEFNRVAPKGRGGMELRFDESDLSRARKPGSRSGLPERFLGLAATGGRGCGDHSRSRQGEESSQLGRVVDARLTDVRPASADVRSRQAKVSASAILNQLSALGLGCACSVLRMNKGSAAADRDRIPVACRWSGLLLVCLLGLALPQHARAEGSPESLSAHQVYTVNSGDVLRVTVWKEPELSADVTVRLDGKFTLPLLGDVMARGRTPEEIAAEVSERLERYVEDAMVIVGVTEARSAQFYVIGQVGKAGAFALGGPITVVQALALAGGFQTFAKRDKIVLIRGSRTPAGTRNEVLSVNYEKLEKGETRDNYVLEPGDTLVVP